jgi:metallo-beta-lactamase family protein
MARSSPRQVAGFTLQFLGAAGTVTGSKHLVAAGGQRILLDCGLFQGLKALRQRNWAPPPVAPADIAAIVLSHAHIDHSGALPLFVRRGFQGPVYCTPATAELLEVLLLDAAHLQEEEAEFANRHRTSKHRPALPLYTTRDAEAALALRQARSYRTDFPIGDGVSASFHCAGHILGSAIVTITHAASRRHTLVFSGDLGRWNRPILHDPTLITAADTVLVESTYGDRTHPAAPVDDIIRLIHDVADRRGVLLVPAFAVDRTQELLYGLRQLEDAGRIPALPVFIDSPMAIDVTEIYLRHPEEHDLDMARLAARGASPLATRRTRLLRTPEESKSLNDQAGPMIIISASGMATGGRILHHLIRRLPDPSTTVALVGYQAAGTRGRALEDGAQTLRVFGQDLAVRARVLKFDGLSAHADQTDLLRWLRGFQEPPRQTFVVHGEPQPADVLAAAIRTQLQWNARVAEDREVVALT